MEIHAQRRNAIQDQENMYVGKGKTNLVVPLKRQGLGVRGALGEMNTNVQIQPAAVGGKVAVAAAEYEKKAKGSLLKSNYVHIQSKIDTGLTLKTVQPSARPPLRREESTASLAAKATIRTRAALKDAQNKPKIKDSTNGLVQPKKAISSQNKENKKVTKVPSFKESVKVKETKPKPVCDPVESLEKLKLAEPLHKAEKKVELKESLLYSVEEIIIPDDIEDIDASDKNNPLLMSIYIKDIYNYLRELEVQYPIEPDHLKKQTEITGRMRATLIDWLVEVQKQFSLGLETFHLTVGIIDRYLQAVPNLQRNKLQLVGVTAMYIASKYEEIYAPDVGDFVYVTDKAYRKADVFQCEREILMKLGFCLARPIPLSFLRRFVKAAHGTSKNHHLAKYFVDLCLIEYSMSHYRPSELAAAAICLSLHLLSNKKLKDVWTPTLSYYSGYDLQHIEPIIRKIAKIVINVETSKYKAVSKKYQDVALAKVSTLPELKSEDIYELAKLPSE